MGNQFEQAAIIACLKSCLFTFNIVFWIYGVLMLMVGLWAEFEMHKYVELSPDFSGTAAHLIVGIALLIVVVTSIAFSCIVKGQPVLLYLYGGFLACIFMMDAGVGISFACYRSTFGTGLRVGLTKTISSYNPQDSNLDFAQQAMRCCGVDSFEDWIRLSPQKVIPMSCCYDPQLCITANYSEVYHRGCYEVIAEFLRGNIDILTGLAIGSAFYPLFGTVLSYTLANHVKAAKYDAVN